MQVSAFYAIDISPKLYFVSNFPKHVVLCSQCVDISLENVRIRERKEREREKNWDSVNTDVMVIGCFSNMTHSPCGKSFFSAWKEHSHSISHTGSLVHSLCAKGDILFINLYKVRYFLFYNFSRYSNNNSISCYVKL